MKTAFFILSIILLPLKAFGTAQIPDKLIFNGKIHYVYDLGLAKYMHDNMTKYSSMHKKKYEYCSANWDWIIAVLEIKEGKLYIKKLGVGCESPERLDFNSQNPEDIFGISIPEEGLSADWFTGCLKEYYGEQWIMHEKSHFSEFCFKNGVLIIIEEKENEDYRKYVIERKKDKASE